MLQQLTVFPQNSIYNPKYSKLPSINKSISEQNRKNEITKTVSKQVKRELTIIPTLAIHPNRIVQYNQVIWSPNKPQKKISYEESQLTQIQYKHLLESRRTANGNVSNIARRKISKAIEYLLFLANPKTATSQLTGRLFNFRIAFITLTLPSKQQHSDNIIKQKLLNSFLIELTKIYHVKNYVWRAEKQLNGNIHFHIIVDKFIPWSELRARWNRITNKLGYVDRYRADMKKFHKNGFQVRKKLLKKWSYKSQINAYKVGKLNDWNSPNSTDIHSIQKIRNIKNYITKYMVKNEDAIKRGLLRQKILEIKNNFKNNSENQNRREIRKLKKLRNLERKLKKKIQVGRVWSCNQALSNPKGAQIEISSDIASELDTLLKKSNCKIYDADYFSVYSLDFSSLFRFGSKLIFRSFLRYMSQEFGYVYQENLF